MSLRTLIGAGAVGVLVFAGVPAAQADTPTPAPSSTAAPKAGKKAGQKAGQKQLARRAKRMCARVDRVEKRVDRLITRLSAGPDTRGSVKWSQKRAAAVRSKDAARAELIDGRVRIQQSRLNTLQLRKQQLPKVTTWCDAHGLGSGG